MSIQLPLVVPPFQTIAPFTQYLSILYANHTAAAENWVCNNCLTISFHPSFDGVEPDYLLVEPMRTFFLCKLLDDYKAPYEFFEKLDIKEILSQGYYIFSEIDAFELPSNTASYQIDHRLHPVLMNGYEGDLIFIADHFLTGSGHYTVDKTELSHIKKAFHFYDRPDYNVWDGNPYGMVDNTGGVHLLKFRSELAAQYELDRTRVKYLLTEHRYSRLPREFRRFAEDYDKGGYHNRTKVCAGFIAYDQMMDHIRALPENLDDQQQGFQLRYLTHQLHDLLEHARILALLVDKLALKTQYEARNAALIKYLMMAQNRVLKESLRVRDLARMKADTAAFVEKARETDLQLTEELLAVL